MGKFFLKNSEKEKALKYLRKITGYPYKSSTHGFPYKVAEKYPEIFERLDRIIAEEKKEYRDYSVSLNHVDTYCKFKENTVEVGMATICGPIKLGGAPPMDYYEPFSFPINKLFED